MDHPAQEGGVCIQGKQRLRFSSSLHFQSLSLLVSFPQPLEDICKFDIGLSQSS